jgi:hypothetical protein
MATGVTKLRPAKAPEPNPRAALATALKELKSARTAVNRQKEAKERLFARQIEAQAAIEPAEKAVKKAQAAYVDAVAQAAASGSPEPVSGVAEALAALAFKQDQVHTLRAARKVIEEELPGWEEEAAAADVAVEACISRIIADHVEVLLKEAEELARRLQPYRAALLTFARDHEERPSEWHLQTGYRKSREPLNDLAERIWSFLRGKATAPSPCWKTLRENLRQNPNAPLLRPLTEQFAGLLDKSSDDDRPQPA